MSADWGALILGTVTGIGTLIATIVGTITWLSARFGAVIDKVHAVGEMAKKDNDALDTVIMERIEAVKAVEQRARHDLSNRVDVRMVSISNTIEQMRERTATRAEVAALESRMTAAISKLEQALGILSEKVGQIEAVKAQSQANGEMLQRLLSRN